MPDYLIKTTIPHEDTPAIRERLVRAKNQAAALKHVVADTIKVEPATIDDAMRIAGAGGKVEVAAEDAA